MNKLISLIFLFTSYSQGFSQNPRMVKNVVPGPGNSNPTTIVKAGSIIFYNAADNNPSDYELYRSDGTKAGTDRLDYFHGNSSTFANRITVVDLNKVVFFAEDAVGGNNVYVSNGSQSGTFILENISSLAIAQPTFYNGFVYYIEHTISNHLRLRRTDGTIGGTSLITDLGLYTLNSDAYALTIVNNILYFNIHTSGAGGNDGDVLWRSDGSPGGTAVLKDLGPPGTSLRSDLMRLGNNFYFITTNGSDTLWKSDGTPGGTGYLKLIALTGNVNNVPQYIELGGFLYMTLDDNTHGREIWITDGTPAGTLLWADINTGINSSNPMYFTQVNTTVYFVATTASNGRELWKVNATGLASLQMDQDINPGGADGNPGNLVHAQNPSDATERLIFTANNGVNGVELFCAYPLDNSHNVYLLKDLYPGATSSNPDGLTNNYPVYFAATDLLHGRELQRLDAIDCIWKGSDIGFTNDWSVANCWSGENMPTISKNVLIPNKVNGNVPNCNLGILNQSCNHLWINDAGMNIPFGKTLTIAGDISNFGTLNSPGTIIFTGGPPSTIHCPGNNLAPMILSNKQMSLTNDINASMIDLTNGSNIILDTFDLNMGSGTLNGNSSNFVITNDTGMVTRSVGASAVTFPVGINSTSYNPVTITKSGGGSADFAVRVLEGVRTQGLTGTSTTNGMVNRMWVVTQTSGTNGSIDLAMQWNSSDELPGFTRANASVANYAVCPPPVGCTDGFYQASTPAPASGSNPYTLSRTGTFALSETPFIITNNPVIYSFIGNGDWLDPANWINNMVPTGFITPYMDITINPTVGGECIYNGNLTVAPGGNLVVLPGKKLTVTGNLWQQ